MDAASQTGASLDPVVRVSSRLVYPHRFSVAPMIDWTDRHCRALHRVLTTRALLYTPMIHANAVVHGRRDLLLDFASAEHPVALQLGGSDPAQLAEAARIGASWGYDEINLNVGCPSDRVQQGSFGACLMATPELVAQCVAAMRAAVTVPVTVKCRIGIDDQDAERDLEHFVTTVAREGGCGTFIIHARKAWLRGLSPKENRTIPPLDYARVYRLKAAHPELTIILNGGITSLEDGITHIEQHGLDGVMLGRASYNDCFILNDVDRIFYGEPANTRTREDIVAAMRPYLQEHLRSGGALHQCTRHYVGLFAGQVGARSWRRLLTDGAAAHSTESLQALDDALVAVCAERNKQEQYQRLRASAEP